MLVEPTIIEVANEKEHAIRGPLVIEPVAKVLPAAIDVLRGKAIREAKEPTMADLPAVQAMAKVLSVTFKLLVVEVARDTTGDVGAHEG